MHMAPELIMNRRSRTAPFPATMSGDVYAVGCVMYQILYRLPLIADEQLWPGKGNVRAECENVLYFSPLAEFITDVLSGNRTPPVLDYNETQPESIVALIRSTQASEPTERPVIRALYASVTRLMKLE
jgi:serine/threonine protein kinase